MNCLSCAPEVQVCVPAAILLLATIGHLYRALLGVAFVLPNASSDQHENNNDDFVTGNKDPDH